MKIPYYETNNMLNITQNKDQMVYFSSDWHLGHQQPFIWESRGYKSYEDHTDSIIDSINKEVRLNDILFYLGDLCLNTPIEKFEEYIGRIVCQNVWMIFGNHNNPHEKSIYQPLTKELIIDKTKNYQVYPVAYKNVKYLGHYYEVSVNGQVIILFHYPISSWNYMNHGSWHLCGHSHYNFDPSTAENTTAKILDVGWDGFKKVLSFDEVSTIMAKKNITVVDHHS